MNLQPNLSSLPNSFLVNVHRKMYLKFQIVLETKPLQSPPTQVMAEHFLDKAST